MEGGSFVSAASALAVKQDSADGPVTSKGACCRTGEVVRTIAFSMHLLPSCFETLVCLPRDVEMGFLRPFFATASVSCDVIVVYERCLDISHDLSLEQQRTRSI